MFLSRYFPSSTLVHNILNKRKHIHGSCRMLLEGHSCSHTQYQVQKIHFRRMYDDLEKAIRTHKVDASLKG